MLSRRETKTMTTMDARTLAMRGGPFTPSEYALLAQLDHVERLALRHRTVTPIVTPAEAEIDRKVSERFGARRAAAELELADAIAEREAATEAMFRCRSELRKFQSVTWISDGAGHSYERGGSDAQIEAANAQVADAEAKFLTTHRREHEHRVALTSIRMTADAYKRSLST